MEDIIIRFFDGSISLQEKSELLSWLKDNPANRTQFLEMHEIWAVSGIVNETFHPRLAIAVFVEKVKNYEDLKTQPSEQNGKSVRRILYAVSGIAAAVAVMLSLSYVFLSGNTTTLPTYTVLRAVQKEKIVLSDQTVVWLNANTTLYYPETFGKDVRQVKMEGEAFFEVAKDAEKPFVVDLGEDRIRVVGTSFNVKNIPNEPDNEIVLCTGKISLELTGTSAKNIALKPNEKLVYAKATKTATIEPVVDTGAYNFWTKERLIFDNEKLSEVIADLERWYDIKIECPSVLAENITVNFTIVDETIEQTMEVLSLVAPVNYKIKNEEVIISTK